MAPRMRTNGTRSPISEVPYDSGLRPESRVGADDAGDWNHGCSLIGHQVDSGRGVRCPALGCR